MAKCLVTGCDGFIGYHLAHFLQEKGLSVYGTVHKDTRDVDRLKKKIKIIKCDILDKEGIESTIAEASPDYVFHLAAKSLPGQSWQDPEPALKVNILGTLNLLECIRRACIDPIIEIACSSAEYAPVRKDKLPIKEIDGLQPSSPYGVSKLAEDMLSHLYWQTYGMKIIRIRPFFIIGPIKTSDVCSDFAKGIAEIEMGKGDFLQVGNIDTVRDFMDIKDGVAAMWFLAEKGVPGEVYNISSGRGYNIKDILDILISLSYHTIKIHQNPDLLRPVDQPVVIGDNSKLRSLGWKQTIPVEQSLSDILDYWREQMADHKTFKSAIQGRLRGEKETR